MRCYYQHRAEFEAVLRGATRDAAFDTFCARIGATIAAYRTLDTVASWQRDGRVQNPAPML
jgi:hypothetical protein